MPKSAFKITGDRQLVAKFQELSKTMQGKQLARAATAGMLPVQNEAILKVVKKSGDLSRSIHTEIIKETSKYAEAATGTDKEYAARIEFGYSDTDRLGRTYNQSAQPYLRPAMDTKRGEAIKETQAALVELINAAIK